MLKTSARIGNVLLPIVAALMVFGASFLLFLLEPMVGKILLPFLGGTPLVWNTCLVFFQCALLAGYLISTGLALRMRLSMQAVTVLVLMALPFMLPEFIRFAPDAETITSARGPIAWLLSWLTLAIGMPFVVLSIFPSLMQSWVSRSTGWAGRNPYLLYAASNTGSLLGLMAYPFIVEPTVGLHDQVLLWKGAYGAFVGGAVITCLLLVLTTGKVKRDVSDGPTSPVSASSFVYWTVLSAIPSALLSAVTQYLLTDLLSAPLLWLIPLAIYLLTWIIAFTVQQRIPLLLISRLVAFFAMMIILTLAIGATEPAMLLAALHLALFFYAALFAHTLLSVARPESGKLTVFYLAISLGGAIGGLMMLLGAPLIFSTTAEYPIMVILAVSLRIVLRRDESVSTGELLKLAALTAALVVLARLIESFQILPEDYMVKNLMIFAPLAIFCYSRVHLPRQFVTVMATIWLLAFLIPSPVENELTTERNFFGTLKVTEHPQTHCRSLYYGTTIHGIECPTSPPACEPLSYYQRNGPAGWTLQRLAPDGPALNIAVIGLGIGTMGCYTRPQDQMTFYELNPMVTELAQARGYFQQMARSPGKISVEMGDARLTLEASAPRGFDMMVIDAFSSDSIPVHLLTREAIDLYRRHQGKETFLMFHISNRFFDLRPVLANIARELSLEAWLFSNVDTPVAERTPGGFASEWVILTDPEGSLRSRLLDTIRAVRLSGNEEKIWTDQFSSPLSRLRPQLFSRLANL